MRTTSTTTRGRPLRRVLAWGLGLVALAAVAAVGARYAEIRALRARGMHFLADVFVRWPDGRVEQLTPGDGIYHFATIRPDGARVVYEGGSTGCVRLWEMDLETRDVEPITPADSAALHPNYSWDGSEVVFISDRDTEAEPYRVEELPMLGMYGEHRFNLYVRDMETGVTRRVTEGPHQDFRPSFSPDGETIVFATNRAGGSVYRLWTVAADGGEEPRPIGYEGPGYNAWYAVDGESIFFHTVYEGREHAVRYTLGEEMPVPLPNDDFERTHGEFADPDGDVLLVHAVHEGRWGMWELPLDGGPARPCQVPGLENGMHGARSRNDVLTFDVERIVGLRADLAWRLRRLLR